MSRGTPHILPPANGGVVQNKPSTQLPQNALNDARNIIYLNGILRARPGYETYTDNRVLGTIYTTSYFTGSGLDDITIAGAYTGGITATAAVYQVKIDGTGTPDTFKWSDDGGSSFKQTGISIVSGAQTLNNGVTIEFAATTGHTSDDLWEFGIAQFITEVLETKSGTTSITPGGTYSGTGGTAYIIIIDSEGTPDTFKWSSDGGVTFTTGVNVATSAVALSGGDGITVRFSGTDTGTLNDTFRFSVSDNIDVQALRWALKTPTTSYLVAATTISWSKWSSGSWAEIPGETGLSALYNDFTRFVVFDSRGTKFLLGTNGVNKIQKWSGTSNREDLTSSPAAAKDLVVAFNRVIAINIKEGSTWFPNRVRISNFNDHTDWPANLAFDLLDGQDVLVGGMPLSRTTVAVHGTQSQWVGVAQSSAFPFRFEMVDNKIGPASKLSIVKVGNRNYYIGRDLNIYVFDGNKCQIIGDPIHPVILNNVNSSEKELIHGVYLTDTNDIWWFFPSAGTQKVDFGVCYNIDENSFYPLSFTHGLTASSFWEEVSTTTWADLTDAWSTYTNSWSDFTVFGEPSFVYGSENGVTFNRIGIGDDGAAYPVWWEHPIFFDPSGKTEIVVDAMEGIFKNNDADVKVNYLIIASDVLNSDTFSGMDDGDSVQLLPAVSLSQDERKIVTPHNSPKGRFIIAKFSRVASDSGKSGGSKGKGKGFPGASNVTDLEFLGGVLYYSTEGIE